MSSLPCAVSEIFIEHFRRRVPSFYEREPLINEMIL